MALELTWPQALAWRLRRHHLVERAPADAMLDVIARIGGLHAQVMSSAELTLHARVEGLEPDAVQRALWEERSLLKLWAMRGTLHLLPSSELDTWFGALGTYRNQGWISPVLLVDGRMEGVWKYERKGKRLVVTIEPFGKAPKRVRTGAEAEAERVAAFLGEALELSWS